MINQQKLLLVNISSCKCTMWFIREPQKGVEGIYEITYKSLSIVLSV